MNESEVKKSFGINIKKGREFEKWERSFWQGKEFEGVSFEKQTAYQGKKGRVDIELDMTDIGQFVLVEIKATDWEKINPTRVRPNVLRHARQLERYLKAAVEMFNTSYPNANIFETSEGIVPAIIYINPPSNETTKELIVYLLNERAIQVVWRTEWLNG